MNELTETQVITHEWLVNFMIENHRAPILQEIADNFCISKKAAHDRVNAMRKKGLVREGKWAIPTGIKVIKNI